MSKEGVKMRRRVLWGLLVVFLLSGLPGCGGEPEPAQVTGQFKSRMPRMPGKGGLQPKKPAPEKPS